MKVLTKPHSQFNNKKCVLVETNEAFYAFFGEARHFMEVQEGFKHSGCLSKFHESEGAPFSKAIRDGNRLPHVETVESIHEYFGKSDNFFI